MAIITVLGFLVCSRGIQKGIEKVSKVMMIALLILILVLAGNSLFLSGAGEGLSFYLIPDLNKVNEIGLGNVISSAMNQAFFTLSLGIAAMEIFGSYMSKTTLCRVSQSKFAHLTHLLRLWQVLSSSPLVFHTVFSPTKALL